jgi:uncharacterized protein (DUF2141 family)
MRVLIVLAAAGALIASSAAGDTWTSGDLTITLAPGIQ